MWSKYTDPNGVPDVAALFIALMQALNKRAEDLASASRAAGPAKVEAGDVKMQPVQIPDIGQSTYSQQLYAQLYGQSISSGIKRDGLENRDNVRMDVVAVQANTAESAENLNKKIEYWKRELLDTGKRNRMINYKETTRSRSTLPIVEPDAATLFNQLTSSEKPLSFPRPSYSDFDISADTADTLAESASSTQKADIKAAGTLIECIRTLRNLRSKAKLAQEEQGTNILYLCFGFICWREQDKVGGSWLKAPLLMMPVSLGYESLNAPYKLSKNDEEIEVNPTLAYLFYNEYHIELPEFELKNKQSFNDYMRQVEDLARKQGWSVTYEVSLGLFSFQKISMYHDLNNNRDLIMKQPVLRAMAGDRTAIAELPVAAEKYDFDAADPTDWHEVVDADSSQEEAILLSRMGVSFVLEGPPGTGKSQTITNIIAEAMASGKKVLFVSEKAAALQVVLKRLTEVHLDEFCLSLHDYKANKKEIIDLIGANLNLEADYVDRSVYGELRELFHDRDFLNSYTHELHTIISPLNQSPYMVFGKLSKLEKASHVDFSLSEVSQISEPQLSSMRYSVSSFEKALQHLGGSLSDNPWYMTKARTSGQNYKVKLLHETDNLSSRLREIASLAGRVDEKLQTGYVKTYAEVEALLQVARALEKKPAYISRKWLNLDHVALARERLEEARLHADRLYDVAQTVRQDWQDSIFDLNLEEARTCFNRNFHWLFPDETLSLEEHAIAEGSKAQALLSEIEEVLDNYTQASALLEYIQDDTLDHIRMIARVLELISNAPYMDSSWFDVRKNAEQVPLVEEAIKHSDNIAAITEEILKEWEPSALELDTEDMLTRFKTEYVGLFHKMKANYKEDLRTLRIHSKMVGGKLEESSVISFLQNVKTLQNEKKWFSDNEFSLATVMGRQYRGGSVDWHRVHMSMGVALEIANQFPYGAIPEKTIKAIMQITHMIELSGIIKMLSEKLATYNLNLLERQLQECSFENEYQSDESLGDHIVLQLTETITNCSSLSQFFALIRSAKVTDGLQKEDVTALLENLAIVNEELDWFLTHDKQLKDIFDNAYIGQRCDWNLIAEGLNTSEQIASAFGNDIPETVVSLACSSLPIDAVTVEQIDDLSELVKESKDKLAFFNDQFINGTFESVSLQGVAERYDACVRDFEALSKWLDYVETREACDKQGLTDFTAKITDADNSVKDVLASFEKGFYSQWIDAQLSKVPAIQSFRRHAQEQHCERFVRLDTKQYAIARKRIRERIISTYPNLNRVARAGSEIGILRHEMEKKRRFMPLRKLFRSIPTLLMTLKPCFMMSPLSVAYFLDADAYKFDMVIFDEASQIFPQDAIGAIFRAKQVIIAGDTKQLPPTNFFTTSTSNDSDEYDEDELSDVETYDSILEETSILLPNRTLLWHYRSKHEQLIAFSNQEIYHNNLVTFPSSNESEPDTGVEFVYVEDGYYEGGGKNCNILEARRCVELVRDHIERHPNRSLGIIAFSEKQQQAILFEIQKFRESHPEYEEFFIEGKEDEFFVKNLENVQGDERDTIFFSVGYAKTKEQKESGKPMAMRFGPLGVSGGERRLNVAITRAKTNIKLVSSILSSDIDLSRTSSEGVRMLRSYIEFAMGGENTLASAHRVNRRDDFVDSIASFIGSHGYTVKQYVGCSGYKIDIAIRHPSKDIEEYVAGVECDGFSYAAARTARDRDRLRTTVLKNMGWNLYRVWSAEWYKNPEVESQKLLKFIESAIKLSDARIKKQEEERRKEEEAKRLEREKARKAREVEEQRRKREQEEAEEKLKAEREAAARKKMEVEEREAKLRAEQAALLKQAEEQKRAAERREKERLERARQEKERLEKERQERERQEKARLERERFERARQEKERLEKERQERERLEKLRQERVRVRPQSDNGLAWAKLGASVNSKTFGKGVITEITDTKVSVRFPVGLKYFVYPSAFTQGYLTRVEKECSRTTSVSSHKDPHYDDYRKRLVDAVAILRQRYYAKNRRAENTGKVRYENQDLRLASMELWIRIVTGFKPSDFLVICDIVNGNKAQIIGSYTRSELKVVMDIITENPDTRSSWVRVKNM